METWQKVLLGIGVAFIVLVLINNFTKGSWADVHDACTSEGVSASTCTCVVERMEAAGYEPEDVEGENYSPGALLAAASCF